MAQLRIPTTQNVTLEYETASIGERIAATLLDGVVQAGWVILWLTLLFGVFDVETSRNEVLVGVVVIAVVVLPLFVYHLVSEALWQGQSIGKRIMKVRVISLNGTPARFTQYLLRWVLRIVDVSMFYGIVAIACILGSGRGQRLGDMAAGTAVVRLNRRQTTADNSLFGSDYDSNYRVTFPQVASLADHDVRLIQELVTQSEKRGAYHILDDVAQRVRTLTGIETTMPNHEFLLVVLRDYGYLASQAAAH
ncbi:RDD family protein [Hymenobacter latericus]|uniref:RDD family protein n=1 Tax=Hymenobacter sp. YIM 151858-1 TaxID=2987688 RepID=UPI002225C8AE|nr:RDD family protein [Hymenobacter sp. YIM 151858-1]UYZ59298.1 RDD family protein [Hymenobacter sp. YIM 151858-1]